LRTWRAKGSSVSSRLRRPLPPPKRRQRTPRRNGANLKAFAWKRRDGRYHGDAEPGYPAGARFDDGTMLPSHFWAEPPDIPPERTVGEPYLRTRQSRTPGRSNGLSNGRAGSTNVSLNFRTMRQDEKNRAKFTYLVRKNSFLLSCAGQRGQGLAMTDKKRVQRPIGC